MMALKMEIVVDDKGTPTIRKVREETNKVGDESEKASHRFSKSFNDMKRVAGGTAGAVRDVATSMKTMVTGGAVAVGFGGMVKSGIGINAQLESITAQFKVMYGDIDRANMKMAELVKFSAETPFQLAEVANGARILEAFALGGADNLRMVGDAAAAAQRPIEEVAMTFGRIKSGAFGEAFMRLGEMGLATRKDLEGEGLTFDKGGSFVGTADQAMAAVSNIVNRRFGGMMAEMSTTWNGLVSNLKDNWALFSGKLTKPLFERLKPEIASLVSSINTWADSPEAAAFADRLADGVGRAIGAIKTAIAWVRTFVAEHPQIVDWLGRSAKVFGILAGAILVVNAAMAINPWVLAAVGVAALVAGVWKFIDAVGGIRNALTVVADYWDAFFGGVWESLKIIAGNFTGVGRIIAEVFKAAFGTAKDVLVAYLNQIKDFAIFIKDVFTNVGSIVKMALTGDIRGAFDAAKDIVVEFGANTVDNFKDVGAGRWSEVGVIFGEEFGDAFNTAFGDRFAAANENRKRLMAAHAAEGAAAAAAAVAATPAAVSAVPGIVDSGAGSGGGTVVVPVEPVIPVESVVDATEQLEAVVDSSVDKMRDQTFARLSDAWASTWDTMLFATGSKAAAITNIARGMYKTLLSDSGKYVGGYLANEARRAIGAKAVDQAVTAATVANSAVRITASGAEAAAKEAETAVTLTSAAAKMYEAHAWIPFVGGAIAAVAVGAMYASFSGKGGRSAGADKAGGSSGGARAAEYYNAFGTGSADKAALNLTINGRGDLSKEEVEELVAPLLKRLANRRRIA